MQKKLVPEKRIDRNGRLVTRYVTRDADFPTPTRFLPKLAALFGTKQEPLEVEVRMDCIRQNRRFIAMDRKSRKALLDTLHPDTMSILAKHSINSDAWHSPLPEEIVSYCIDKVKFSVLNDVAAYIDDHGTFKGHTYGELEPFAYLLGLQSSHIATLEATFYLKNYSEADAEQRQAQHALIRATRTLNRDYVRFSSESEGPIFRRLNGDLSRYIMENHENADKIVRVINARGIMPTGKGLDAIKGIVAAGDEIGTTLSDGAL